MNLLEAAFAPRRNRLVSLQTRVRLEGIADRRAFDAGYAAAVESCATAGRPLSVLLVDVDAFAQYNETYGYRHGDDALRVVADCIAHMSLRRDDFCARYDGAAFAIVLPLTDANGAAKVADRLRTAVELRALEHRTSAYGLLTVSIGIGTLPGRRLREADGDLRLFAMARTGLCSAKEHGRNRIEHSETAPGLRVA